ncbi:MAG: ROK family protein [Bacteroidales bacterium]
MDHVFAIGVDVGGSHISSVAVDLTTGKFLKETFSERSVNNQALAAGIISGWASCISETINSAPSSDKLAGIGFAMPGPFDYVNGIALFKGVPKYGNLYGFNIGDAMRSSLEFTEEFRFRFINDASSFAIGEAWTGKAAGSRRSVAITLGTGFGSAFIEDKIPVVDGPLVPPLGCLWHLPYEKSIADDHFSTRWFLNEYRAISGEEVRGVKELAEIAVADKRAAELFLRFGGNLGHFLAPWLKGFGAEVLVIGGNISNAWKLFGGELQKSLTDEDCSVRTEISELKEEAALLGSAFLFDEDFWKSVQHALPLM